MPTKPADIRAEHEAAIASLTPVQWRALERSNQAERMASFTVATRHMRLEALFEDEARARNEAAGG